MRIGLLELPQSDSVASVYYWWFNRLPGGQFHARIVIWLDQSSKFLNAVFDCLKFRKTSEPMTTVNHSDIRGLVTA